MSWISTWTGRQIYPLDPKPDQICLEDIAHGLSHKCRYNGQSLFYTVAEHSVHLADWCLRNGDRRLALYALLHDAAEAYLPDVTAPIKPLFPEFGEREDKMLEVIFEALGVPVVIGDLNARILKDADRRICLNERDTVLPNHRPEVRWPVDGLIRLHGVEIHCWPPDEAYDNFMACYEELTRAESEDRCKHLWHELEVDGDKLLCRSCGERRDIEDV